MEFSPHIIFTLSQPISLARSLRTKNTDVLNGIAVQDGRIYLTGKRWPRLYEVELISK